MRREDGADVSAARSGAAPRAPLPRRSSRAVVLAPHALGDPQPALFLPGADLPAVLLHGVRRRAVGRSATPRASTTTTTTRSSSSSCCCSRRPSAACSSASRSAPTSTPASRAGCSSPRRDRSAVVAGFGMAALVRALMVWAMVFAIALVTGMEVAGSVVDLVGLLLAGGRRQRRRVPVRRRDDDPLPHDAGRAGDADPGLHDPDDGAGLRAPGPDRGLGRDRRRSTTRRPRSSSRAAA